MATSATFYLNAPSLGSATAVFTDPEMTICAGDGFYSDGVIVRELVSCSLLPQETCAGCGPTQFDVAVWARTSEPLAELPCPDCPPEYTATIGSCYLIETTAATPPTSPTTLNNYPNIAYGNNGTLIFDNVTIDGAGVVGSHLTSSFWTNTSTTTGGRMNDCGVWDTATPSATATLGFTACIEVLETKTYFVGFGNDNYGTLYLNGSTPVFTQNATIMKSNINAQGYPTSSVSATPFEYWYIYPIVLNAGTNYVTMKGTNIVTSGSNPALLGCEIYNATPSELAAVTNYTELTPYLLFTSKSKFGSAVEIGDLGAGYTCPEGYQLSCSEPYYCVKRTDITCPTTTPTYDTANVYYSYGSGGTDILLGAISSTSCDPVGTIPFVPAGETIHIGIKNGGLGSVQFGSDEGLTMPCPSDYITYCGTVHSSTGVSYVITADTKVSLTANTTGGSFVTC